MDMDITKFAEYTSTMEEDDRRKYATREEAYEAHKLRVRAWQDKNKDKVKKYVTKYSAKEDVKEIRRQYYHDLSPERKEALKIRNRDNYRKRRLEAEKDPAALEALRASQRAKYHQLSPEQKYELNEKRKAFNARKKAEHEHTDS